MAQVVQADAPGADRTAEPDPASELDEGPGEDVVVESGAPLGNEERAAEAVVAEGAALPRVGSQSGCRGRMEWHEARLAELGAMDLKGREHASEIDVVDVEADRFAGAEPAARQQPDHGGDGVRA